MNKVFDCVIIGAGPSGIGCAIELKKKGFDVVLIEKSMPGGKVNIAPRVDNYPGQHEIPGPDLAMIFYQRVALIGRFWSRAVCFINQKRLQST